MSEETNQNSISSREWLIAILASLIIVVLGGVMLVVAYGWLTREPVGGGQGSAPSGPAEGQEDDISSEAQLSLSEQSEDSSPDGMWENSYMVTNPVESMVCVFSFVLLLVVIIGLELYLRKRRASRPR